MYKLTQQTQDAEEDKHCMAFWQWCLNHSICRDYMSHIPNGGKREVKTYINKEGLTKTWCPQGRKLQLMGTRPGFPDYFLAYPVAPYYGLFLEAKPKFKGKPTPQQSEFLSRMASVGFQSAVAHGVDEMIAIVKQYLGERNDLVS